MIALGGGEPARELVVELLDEVAEASAQVAAASARVAALAEHVSALGVEVEKLRRVAGRDSANSSMPSSSDRPKSRAERRAAAREQFKRSARAPGGQPGHEGKTREMAAPERVDQRFDHLPAGCECGHRFDGTEQRLGDPVLHQVWELPPIEPLIFEHRLHRLACPCCGRGGRAELPAGVCTSAFGPRLQALIGILAGVYRLSRRQTQDVVREIFAISISLGAVDQAIIRMSRILADPWAELREAVQEAEVIHADETSWRLRGAQQWLWLAASSLVACYRIDPSRSQAAAKELLGEDFGGIAITDRYAGYHFLDVLQQQLCWCHVKRQLVEISQRPGAPGRLGAALAGAASEVFAAHRAYLQGGHELAWLHSQLQPLRERIEGLLRKGARSRHAKTANFCAGLLEEYEALWTFCEVERVEPTNNAAERAVRHAVIMRKTQLGTQSDHGSRWIERICSIQRELPATRALAPGLPDRGGSRCSRRPASALTGPSVIHAGTRLTVATPRERLQVNAV